MKAFLVYDKGSLEEYCAVVFAETRNQARYIALSTDACDGGEYSDIVAHRLPVADSQYKEGKKGMDWDDPKDRTFLVKHCGYHCADPELDECEKCSAKDYCETYDDLREEYASDIMEV